MSDDYTNAPPPEHPGDDPAQPAPDSKPWWKQWWGIALIAIVAIAVISGITGEGAEDGPEEDSPDVAATQQDTEAPQTDEPTQPPTEQPTVATVTTPDLIGQTRNEAQLELTNLGLEPSIEEREIDDEDSDGVVLEQSPAPGSDLQEGDTVVLTVGVYTGPEFGAWEPFELSGSGDDIVDLVVPEDEPAIIEVSYEGGGNFAIITYLSDGERGDLLVNNVGSYQGIVPVNFAADESVAEAEITASGPWTMTVKPLMEARRATDSTTGQGDEVILIDPSTLGTRARITYDGESNFAVIAWGAGRDLLVNEVGSYEGTVRVPEDALVLEITASGQWNIDFE